MQSQIIKKIRNRIIELSYYGNSAHLGSSLSCVEILFAIFSSIENSKKFKNSDVIVSKGHASMAYLSILEHFKLIKDINHRLYLKNNSNFWGHISRNKSNKYFKFSFGSLGYGLGISCGIAYNNIHKKNNNFIFTLLSDGELNEGSTFEAIQFASHHNLKNLIIFIDNNKIQSLDRTKNVLNIDYYNIFKKLNFTLFKVNGHDLNELTRLIYLKSLNAKIIFCNTIKGKGIPRIENTVESHYKPALKEDIKK